MLSLIYNLSFLSLTLLNIVIIVEASFTIFVFDQVLKHSFEIESKYVTIITARSSSFGKL